MCGKHCVTPPTTLLGESLAVESKLNVYSVIEVCGWRTLLATVIADYLTPGNVGNWFPRILGGSLSVASYLIEFFAVIGVIVVV